MVENTKQKSPALYAAIMGIVGAALLIAAFFLPYGAATQDYRADLMGNPDYVIDEASGMTCADAADMSLFEYASLYAAQGEEMLGSIFSLYVALMGSALVLAALTLLFALLRKATPTVIFAMLNMGMILLLNWDFADRGVIGTLKYDWGIAKWIYLVGGIMAIAGGIWLFICKHKAKKAAA